MNNTTANFPPVRRVPLKILQLGIILTAIGFIVYGAYRGEVDTVFGKAIKLCLECVGIG